MPRLAGTRATTLADHAEPDHSITTGTVRPIREVARALVVVVVALVWAGLLLALVPGALPARAQAGLLTIGTAATNTPTATATTAPQTPTATTAAATPTTPPASTATTAPPPATATTSGSSGGGGGQPPGSGAQAPTPVTTRIDLAQPTLGAGGNGGSATTFTPSNLTSNGLAIFTTLGCIVGLIGLLAVGITWITLVSDGWGPMIKAVVRGNRRGKLRFARKGADGRGAARARQPVSAPKSHGGSRGGSRGGWR